MSIESSDMKLLLDLRQRYPEGKSCAILGDVVFHCFSEHEMRNFISVMGFDTVDTFDINGNPTHKLNLNEPLPKEFHSKYDWVIDSGTLYCCFNIAMVWKNILLLLKESGTAFHTGALSGFYGRGFYSLSPALFRDFYKTNNFEVLRMGTKTRQVNEWYDFNPNDTYLKSYFDTMEFQDKSGTFIDFIPNDSMIYCFAKREKSVEFTEPIPQHFIDTDGA